MKHKITILPLISALIFTFASCRQNYCVSDGTTWGTTYHIVHSGDDCLHDSILAVMAQIDSSLSLFNPESELCAVNSGACLYPGEGFRTVFECAARVSALSGGLYDPTVAPLVDLWGFGPSGSAGMPDSVALARALLSVGMSSCHIDSTGQIHKKTSATAFDFSSLAKGYGVDCIADMLERNGVLNYMVEIGGEVCARGLSERGRPWQIQIDAPVSNTLHSRLAVVALGPHRSALASSGNYRNYRVDNNGTAYGHTINPLTGEPARTATLAATVSASSCMLADALATAAMCLEPQQALQMLSGANARGLVVTACADTFEIAATPQFP